MNLNKVILIGRTTKDLDVKSDKFATFSIAIKDDYNKDRSDFFDVVVMGAKQIEYLSSRVKKGKLVVVEGRIGINEYKEQKKYQVIANSVKLLQPMDKEANSEDVFEGKYTKISDDEIPMFP
jgi:single-stranded DNA-binding protein